MKLMYFGHEILALFIPIMGRFGHETNPELLVGLLTAVITIKVTSYFTSLILFIRKPWPILALILAAFLAAFILAFTPFGFPYQFSLDNPRPQRYSVDVSIIFKCTNCKVLNQNFLIFSESKMPTCGKSRTYMVIE